MFVAIVNPSRTSLTPHLLGAYSDRRDRISRMVEFLKLTLIPHVNVIILCNLADCFLPLVNIVRVSAATFTSIKISYAIISLETP